MPSTDATSEAAFKILAIVSRPLDLKDLPDLADQWSIYNGLRSVQASVRLEFLQPPTIEQLRQKIFCHFDVIHFDGHGAYGLGCSCCGWVNDSGSKKCLRCGAEIENQIPKGYLAFEKEDGSLDSLEAGDLADLISSTETPPKLIVLSACESAKGNTTGVMETLLQKGSPAALGMKEPVPDNVAKAMAGPFYAALGSGISIKKAFESALPALKNYREVPVLAGIGIEMSLTQKGTPPRKISIDKNNIYGIPRFEFVGEYVRDAPPRGRKGILSQIIQALIQDNKLVALTGQGGIGKTVLAAEAAQRVAWRYPGGVFWRSAADIKEFGLNELLDAFDPVFGLDFRKLPVDDKKDRVQTYLGKIETPCLLVMDNAEKMQDQSLWTFLEGIPQPSAALITIREAGKPQWNEIHLLPMEPGEAETLFVHEALKKKSDWKKPQSQTDKQNIKEIYGILEGQPLGIVLAASLVYSLPLSGILGSLKAHPPTEVANRYDFSYNTLTDGQKLLLQRMSVFEASVMEQAITMVCIDEEAIKMVGIVEGCGEGGKDPVITIDDLGELVRKSFVERIELPVQTDTGEEIGLDRYRLHPLIRQYAGLKAGSDNLKMHRLKAAGYFLRYAQYHARKPSMIEYELQNILAGMDRLVELQNSASGDVKKLAAGGILNFMAPLMEFLDIRGYWNEDKLRLQQAITASQIIDDKRKESICTLALGQIEDKLGNSDEAEKLVKRSQDIQKELAEPVREDAATIHTQGILAFEKCNYEEAMNLFFQSRDIARKNGDMKVYAAALYSLGLVVEVTCNGNYEMARKFYQKSLDIDETFGYEDGIAQSIHALGKLAFFEGKYDEARELYLQSLKVYQERKDKAGIAALFGRLAGVEIETGHRDEARGFLQQSLKISQEIDSKGGIALSLAQLSLLNEESGDIRSALAQIKEAEKIFSKLENPENIKKAEKQRQRLEGKIGIG
jgi:tetratricopeptide (TPR) repeat protein